MLLAHTCAKVFSVGSANDHITWIEKALGGKREMVMADPKESNKVMHAAMQVNGGPLYFSDRLGEFGAPDANEPASRGTHLYLGFDSFNDAQNTWDSAVENNAVVHMEFEAQFWGPHYGVLQDPFGTVWAISAQQEAANDKDDEKEPFGNERVQRKSSRVNSSPKAPEKKTKK
jgi:PhnB protein